MGIGVLAAAVALIYAPDIMAKIDKDGKIGVMLAKVGGFSVVLVAIGFFLSRMKGVKNASFRSYGMGVFLAGLGFAAIDLIPAMLKKGPGVSSPEAMYLSSDQGILGADYGQPILGIENQVIY